MNLMPLTKPPASASKGPKPTHKRASDKPADRSGEKPQNSVRPEAKAKLADRPEASPKALANHPAPARKGSKGDKTGDKIITIDPSLAVEGAVVDIETRVAPTPEQGVFAAILQAAGQTDPEAPVALDTVKTQMASPVSGHTNTPHQVVSKVNSLIQDVTLQDTPGKSETPQEVLAPVTASVGADSLLGRLLVPGGQAVASVAEAKARGSSAAKSASPDLPLVVTQAATPKMAAISGLSEQVGQQVRQATVPQSEPVGEVLKQSSLGLIQNPAQPGNKIGLRTGHNPGSAAYKKIALQSKAAQTSAVETSGVQTQVARRFGALSQGVERQTRIAIEDIAGSSASQAAAQTTTVETEAAQAVETGRFEPISPAKQIADAFRSSADRNGQEIVIRLDPPNLGRVRVALRMDGNEVRGVLDVENPRTLNQLQREAPDLVGRLTDAGIEMKRMDISLSQDGARDSGVFSQQYAQDAPGQGRWDALDQDLPTEEILSGATTDGEDQPAGPPMMIGENSINVWI